MRTKHKMAAGVLVFLPGTDRVLTFYAVSRPGGALPCGKVDIGESPADAAVRECLEETGYSVTLLSDAPYVASTHDGYLVFTFKAILIQNTPVIPSHAFEGRAEWMPYTELLAGPYAQYNKGVLEWFGILRTH